ncbi:MAG: hypothetical protein IRZ15_09345 [Bryobacteraceae bacterium]|nr:hypothetical protein [Bryobacteraceae bacterium]
MRVIVRIKWSRSAPQRPEDRTIENLSRVLRSAAATRYYRPWLKAARVCRNDEVPRSASPAALLACVPRVEASWFLRHEAEFSSRTSRQYKPRLRHPITPTPRTAILDPAYQGDRNCRYIPPDDSRMLMKFEPESIAGPAEALLHLARAVERGRAPHPGPRHSLIVFSDLQRGLLREAERELLWNVFEVPIFEQLRGFGGELLAEECDAHCGLHLVPGEALLEFDNSRSGELLLTTLVDLGRPSIRVATGRMLVFTEERCGCGSRAPRVTEVLPAIKAPARYAS